MDKILSEYKFDKLVPHKQETYDIDDSWLFNDSSDFSLIYLQYQYRRYLPDTLDFLKNKRESIKVTTEESRELIFLVEEQKVFTILVDPWQSRLVTINDDDNDNEKHKKLNMLISTFGDHVLFKVLNQVSNNLAWKYLQVIVEMFEYGSLDSSFLKLTRYGRKKLGVFCGKSIGFPDSHFPSLLYEDNYICFSTGVPLSEPGYFAIEEGRNDKYIYENFIKTQFGGSGILKWLNQFRKTKDSISIEKLNEIAENLSLNLGNFIMKCENYQHEAASPVFQITQDKGFQQIEQLFLNKESVQMLQSKSIVEFERIAQGALDEYELMELYDFIIENKAKKYSYSFERFISQKSDIEALLYEISCKPEQYGLLDLVR